MTSKSELFALALALDLQKQFGAGVFEVVITKTHAVKVNATGVPKRLVRPFKDKTGSLFWGEKVIDQHWNSDDDASGKLNISSVVYRLAADIEDQALHEWFEFSTATDKADWLKQLLMERDRLNGGKHCFYVTLLGEYDAFWFVEDKERPQRVLEDYVFSIDISGVRYKKSPSTWGLHAVVNRSNFASKIRAILASVSKVEGKA